jgi:RNA polymerase sigma-70 factor (ECF subfamily)
MIGRLIPFLRGSSGYPAPDEELVAASARGDPSAVEELFRRHGERVYRTLQRLGGGDAKDLEDLLQTTFLEVQRASSRFAGRASVGTWILGIAINVRRHFVRSEARRRSFNEALEPLMAGVTGRAPDEQVIGRETLARLAAGLAALPEHLRIVFTLADLEGLKGAEIARIIRAPEGTVWRRLHQARIRLRTYVEGGREE